MVYVHVLRVFTDENHKGGNPLGIVLDSVAIADAERQEIAARLGFSETVFVDDVASARLRIFTPARELPLAGHPLVGTAWLLSHLAGTPVSVLRPLLAAEVATWAEEDVTWIRARRADAPDWRFVEADSPAAIDSLGVPPAPEYTHHAFWAWIDRAAGEVRVRVFASDYGIAEDEATGSAALLLASLLGRPLTIRQGKGSVIFARPRDEVHAEVGGLVAEDAGRTL